MRMHRETSRHSPVMCLVQFCGWLHIKARKTLIIQAYWLFFSNWWNKFPYLVWCPLALIIKQDSAMPWILNFVILFKSISVMLNDENRYKARTSHHSDILARLSVRPNKLWIHLISSRDLCSPTLSFFY